MGDASVWWAGWSPADVQAGAAVSVSSDIRNWTRSWGGAQEEEVYIICVYIHIKFWKVRKISVMLVNELKFVSYLVPTNILKVDETDSCN